MEGRVKFFNQKKGYGFISVEDNKKDIFVHYSGIKGEGRRNLNEDDRVSFDMGECDRGDMAVNVVKL